MNDLANKNRPSKFADFVGQEGPVNYLKSIIKTNNHPNGIVLSGNPGTGKTTLADLYFRATLCHNRQEGEYEPCGYCSSCLKEEPVNVTKYRVTEATAFKEVVGDLIAMTKSAPVLSTEEPRDDQLRRFIVIDEIQNASRVSIGPFLDSLEFSHSKVTIILISMDLSKMDPILKDAVESRCVDLSLNNLNEESIANKLTNVFPKLDTQTVSLIAYLAKGNLREAWSLVEFFTAQVDVENITPKMVYDQKFGGLNNNTFDKLIESLQESTWKETRKLLSHFSESQLPAIDMLMRRLVSKDLTLDGIKLVSSLSMWYQCTHRAPLETAFLPYQGRLIIEGDVSHKSVTHRVKGISSSSSDISSMQNNLVNQLSNISGSKVKLKEESIKNDYPFLRVKTWKELIEILCCT